MLQSNISNITKTTYKKKIVKSKPIDIRETKLSYNPNNPNSPPINTPPNINVIREIYLSYLISFKK